MTVLHCFIVYGNQTEIWSYNLLTALSSKKIRNIVAAYYFRKSSLYSINFEYVEFPFNISSRIGQKFSLLQRAFNIISHGLLRYFYDKWTYFTLRKDNINIIHSHFGPTAWRYHWISIKLNKPHVISFYGKDYECLPFQNPIWEKRYSRLFQEASVFICEGSHGANVLKSKGCPQSKIKIVRLGVEVNNIPFTHRLKQVNALKLIQIASFVEKKGHIYTLKSFIKALKIYPNITLTLVGGGDPEIKANIIQMVNEAKILDKVTFINSVDSNQMYDLLANHDVFIHPSCYAENRDCEGGAPVVLLDAQATGMPIITTSHCDIPEEVLDNLTGIICPEKSIDSLVDAIGRFYEMEQREYQQFSQNAYEHIINNYDISKNAQILNVIYQDIAT